MVYIEGSIFVQYRIIGFKTYIQPYVLLRSVVIRDQVETGLIGPQIAAHERFSWPRGIGNFRQIYRETRGHGTAAVGHFGWRLAAQLRRGKRVQ
jgi:hypothetical protein